MYHISFWLKNAGTNPKTRTLFRTIYTTTEETVRLNSKDDKIDLSKHFNVDYPGRYYKLYLFYTCSRPADQDIRQERCGRHIKNIHVLGMSDRSVQDMTTRLIEFVDIALIHEDMWSKLTKTNVQLLVKRQKPTSETEVEIKKKIKLYKYEYKFTKTDCRQHFKTKADSVIHNINCKFGYSTTDEKWEVEVIQSRSQTVPCVVEKSSTNHGLLGKGAFVDWRRMREKH